MQLGTFLHNRYRLEAELGRGGMGIVYRAYDTMLNRSVALKVLSTVGIGTTGQARLLLEAQATAQLNHPNIVNVYDAGEAHSAPFIVMELVEGHSLRQYVPRDVTETVQLGRQICAALEHAHAHGIIHRDLKPENILITQSQIVKLMDFGLARSADAPDLTEEGSIVGTFAYMAPEILMGQPATVQSDLYAFGVMFYDLLTGHAPFTGENLLAVISQHLHATVAPPSSYNPAIAPALESLVLRLLHKQPEDRPASAAEVEQQLALLLSPQALGTEVALNDSGALLERIVRGRLVARERELAEATAMWKKATLGESGALLISGEPGIGKTRLTRELRTRAELERAIVLTGECYAENNAPYAPIAQMLQAPTVLGLIASLPLPVQADLITLAPALRARFPTLPPNPPLEARAEQQRLFESFGQFCQTQTARAATLLVLEDAHWADNSTLLLLRHVVRQAQRLRLKLLVVLTYREVELSEAKALNELLLDLNRERLATRLKLTRLTADQTNAMLAAMFAEEITPDFLAGIYRETEGNPFFVEEVCKALIESGNLYRENGRWRRPHMAEIEIPQSVRAAVSARIEKLPTETQEVLRVAAILGREFDFDTLRAVSEQSEDELMEALEQAERAQLLLEVKTPATARPRAATALRFSFAHALIPTTLRESLSRLRRQRLHRRVAQALERQHPAGAPELAPVLGHHFAEAGEGEKAAHYLLQVGDQARGLCAFTEAIAAYEQALAFLQDSDDDARAARILMRLALLYHSLFDFERSRTLYAEAFGLWQRAGAITQASATPPAPRPLYMSRGKPRTFDPSTFMEVVSAGYIFELFSGLVALTPEGDVVPEMAQSWEMLEAGAKYRFYLRHDWCWSDGQPVTAHDYEYAWRRVLAGGSPLPTQMLAALKNSDQPHSPDLGVRAITDWVLEVELAEPTGYFLYILAFPAAFPVPRHWVEAKGPAWAEPDHIISNGPFRLLHCSDTEIVLERNPKYPRRTGGNVQQVCCQLNIEYTERLAAYQAHGLDICVVHDKPANLPQMRQMYPAEYRTADWLGSTALAINPAYPFGADVRVRRALVQAINYQAFAEAAVANVNAPAHGGLTPTRILPHTPSPQLPYAPTLAQRLLAEAGYPQGQGLPPVEFYCTYTQLALAEYLQKEWLSCLGVRVELKVFDSDWHWVLGDRELPAMYTLAWLADYPDPDSFLRVAVWQLTTWREPEYFQLVAQARQRTDPVERIKLYQIAEQRLLQAAVVMPLFYFQRHFLVKPWVNVPTFPSMRDSVLSEITLASTAPPIITKP